MYPSLIALWFYQRSRRAHWRDAPTRPRLLRGIGRIITGIDISPAAQIGERFSISHGQGVVIGDAIIGDDCRILQGVTIGRDGFEDHSDAPSAYPRIGDRSDDLRWGGRGRWRDTSATMPSSRRTPSLSTTCTWRRRRRRAGSRHR